MILLYGTGFVKCRAGVTPSFTGAVRPPLIFRLPEIIMTVITPGSDPCGTGKKTMKRILGFFKKEPVLTAAWVLAAASAFWVKPNKDYLTYIDWRSLCILWSLMAVMQGFRENGVFDVIGERLLKRTDTVRQLAVTLVALCFFGSMLMTNDVALIAFVPFTIATLLSCGRREAIIPVVVMQTVAANMGSMLTPIGSPQNLYLYAASGCSVGEFIMIMLPYCAASAVLLAVGVLVLKGGKKRADPAVSPNRPVILSKRNLVLYVILFCASLLTVARILPYYISAGLVLIVALAVQRKSLLSVDYSLLFIFIGFFIFTGNVGNIPEIKELLTGAVAGREKLFGILMSQVISNVPATLLLSEFTDDYRSLLTGVDIGGLGTLIASMASLISYKYYARSPGAQRGRYVLDFTLVSIVFLAVLVPLSVIF